MNAPDNNEDGERLATPVVGERVVHLTTVHHPRDPRIFYKQLATLREAGFDAHLIAPQNQREDFRGVTIHPIGETEGRIERLALQPRVWKVARGLDADLYQIHDPELIPLAFFLRKRTGSPVIYDMHENYASKGGVTGRAIRALERWCFQWADHVFLAEKSYASIVNGAGVPHTLLENYFKPLDAPPESSHPEVGPSSDRPTNLVYTGTISKRRGLETMIDLACEVHARNRSETLSMIGICRYPDQRARAERRLRRHDLDTWVDRVGWDEYVPASEMQPYYRDADVGLALCEPHPNLTGSLLTKFYEYLHHGLPIICSDFPLWRDFVAENDCGATVPSGNVSAVIEVLNRWQQNPDRYRELVENTREAAQKYRWEQMGARLVAVYEDLLSVDTIQS